MAKQGRAGPALGIAAFGSFIAGTLAIVVRFKFFAPVLVPVALEFGPPEYFSLITLGFAVCFIYGWGSLLKGLVMIALGLFVSSVGLDIIGGEERFTYDSR